MKIKKIIIIMILFIVIFPIYALDFEINSKEAILYNLNDNEILYEKDSDTKTSIASLTKIVTAITILEDTNLSNEVTITYNMLKGLDGYVKVGLKAGDKVSVKELLYALMLPSAADAAQALAIYKSGSIEEFSNLMNEEVKKIGAINSNFTNPVGKDDENNYSTAKDLATILIYSLNNNTFKEIFEANEYYLVSINKKIEKTTISRKIDVTPIKGLKTGYTDKAGRCLASISTINNIDYLFINLNANSNTLDYIDDAKNIYNYFGDNYNYHNIIDKGDILYKRKIKNSKQKEYIIVADEDISKYLKNDFNKGNITIKYDGIEYITKKIKQNEKIGKLDFYYEDNIIYTMDIYLKDKIKYYNYPLYITIIIISVLFVRLLIVKYKRVK